jgi:nucleotide-binding universal stress UspA family protein
MVLLVPFDGSDLSTAALHRAAEFSEYTEESVLALSIVPEEPDYAIERGWIDEGDPYDPEAIGQRLRDQVAAVAPDVSATAIGTDGTATVGEPATVEATLANDGHLDANQTVNLTVDGAVVDSRNVTVRAGETANVSFETTFDTPGNVRVSVAGTEGTVTVASADGSTDTEGDAVTEGDAESSSTDTESTDAEPTSGQSTGLALAGLGILVIGAAGLIRML